MIARRRVLVKGIVQGVGFRPFVWHLAARHGLGGHVLNDSHGVSIEIEGPEERIEAFLGDLGTQAPPLALITSVTSETLPAAGEKTFVIRPSEKSAPAATLISPDIGVCDDCLAEMRDPGDRRHRYPFINCTNCGPRYSIIEDIPYDRPKTSMKYFTMCPACAAEYQDPRSRRFHAQPNACPVCGPRLLLMEADGSEPRGLDPLAETVRRLKDGKIAAVKGLGGFHLAVDATNREAVLRLRRRKNREEKPMAVMVPDIGTARRLVRLSAREEAILISPRRPIVLAGKLDGGAAAQEVAPGNDCLGVMLPYTPLHNLILGDGGFTALVMTSANLSEEPICIDNREAHRRLAGIADFILAHDRIIHLRNDDSVLRFFDGSPYPIRRSRGWAPAPIILARNLRPVMALGAELKNTVCLAKGNLAFLSQHIGDLENEETFAFFRQTVEHLERILECRAGILAHDLHPDYLSTRYALEQSERPAVAVQHHHAHAVSCMAEHGLEGPVLAVTFDGTGYGPDGHIWGGEFLVADEAGFRRAGHLGEVRMPGGNAAIREPWRMAVSYLFELYGPDLAGRLPSFTGRIPAESLRIVTAMLDKGVNLFPTSSAGRLFDAVASLAGIRDRVSFEGQAAMELEFSASAAGDSQPYDFGLDESGEVLVVDTLPVIAGIVEELERGATRETVSARFHETLAAAILRVLRTMRRQEGLDLVVLSGGVFQNLRLLRRVVESLRADGFRVNHHLKVPANDGGLSLGQALIAHEKYYR